MPRTAKLGQKNGYWYSEAGGKPRYYGRVGEVAHEAALKSFREQMVAPAAAPTAAVLVNELSGRFITWLTENRAEATAKHHRYRLARWNAAVGRLPATSIKADHLEDFRKALSARGFAPDYVKKHLTSVQFLFRRAVRQGWLPAGFSPFDRVEPMKVATRPISEANLLTRAEIGGLLAHADDDLRASERYHRAPRVGEANPWRGFGDMLRIYYATGARTGELVDARVADFQPRSRQLLLGKHKRSNTLKQDESRQISLNAEAYSIIERLCVDRGAVDYIFIQPDHERQRGDRAKPWNKYTLARRFACVREFAGVRSDVTIYSFRHLWISEMLMAGVDVMLVARMAGTSVNMIEKVYGHFRSQSFQDAQAKLDAARGKISDPRF